MKPRRLWVLGLVAIGAACPPVSDPGKSQSSAPKKVVAVRTAPRGKAIRYKVTIAEPQTHYADIEARIPNGGGALELMMAVWTPGSYLVREYSRHVEHLSAQSEAGAELHVTKQRKNRWRVDAGEAREVVLTYRLYGRELGVRANFIDSEMAILNGAPTFITSADYAARRHEVELVLPEPWKTSVTGMPNHPSGRPHHYQAADFDELVDSPIIAGNPFIHEFTVADTPHVFANLGQHDIWDGMKAAQDVKKIVAEQFKFWGIVPYDRFVFQNVITSGQGGGGLEHKTSTLMTAGRWAFRDPKRYKSWLGIVSHELFHTWNVKHLRPLALGPFDYENENYTKSLWIAEGLTSYYADLLLRRAELITAKEYLERVSKDIKTLQTRPGRKVESLRDSSYDAWIKFYRKDENWGNTGISYYTKGALVGLLLDVQIRIATRDDKSLDDVMRAAYERYSGEKGYTPDEFIAVVNEVAGHDLSAWMHRALDSTDELSYEPALAWYGLRFKPADGDKKDRDDDSANGEGDDDDDPDPVWLGLRTKTVSGRLMVHRVVRETPGHSAGFNVEDEILAIGDYRVTAADWDERMKQYRPDDEAEVLVARRDRLMRLKVKFAAKPEEVWKLEVDPTASRLQKRRLSRLLD